MSNMWDGSNFLFIEKTYFFNLEMKSVEKTVTNNKEKKKPDKWKLMIFEPMKELRFQGEQLP